MRSRIYRTRRFLVAATAMTAVAATGIVTAVVTAAPSTAASSCSAGYVALTFDDGPNASTTTSLLNVLKTAGVRATLFNIGQSAQNNQALVKAEAAAGMWIGNHSWSHPYMTSLSSSGMASEISQTQQAIQTATGTAPKLFRPPYGSTNATLKSVLAQYGLTEILWDVDSQDWNGASTSQIVAAAGNLQAGGIMLMHDTYQTTRDAIPQIVTNLASRNLCAGMISPTTGRAVAPDGTVPSASATTTSPSQPATSASSTTPPASGACRVTATVNGWNTGLTAAVTITNTSTATVSGWKLTFTLPSGQTITSGWNATYSPTSGQVTATNASYNGTISPNASVSIGYQATHGGTAAAPTGFALNGATCTTA
ncbi:MAG: polysaccharide deacetylase family protein [Micromonosporaceae bacterium]|nr:polysaccharide deacetylase family protein [Micromonosporaceae bacterium]